MTDKRTEDRLSWLESRLAQLSGQPDGAPAEELPPEQRPDYIEHGSERHAAFLGIRKAQKGDVPQYKGWTLIDNAPLGVFWTPEQLEALLKQKVSGFLTKPVPPQSESPDLPGYAPPMWEPNPLEAI